MHDRLAPLGGELVCEALAGLQSGRLRAQAQPVQGACYAAKIEKSEARIDWREDAEAIARKVRAFDPWPVAETRFHGAQLRIWEAKSMPQRCDPPARAAVAAGFVLSASADGIDVACGRGVLRIAKLQLPGRKPIVAGQFANAQPLAGARFLNE